jgi:hypothetical protein
MSTKISFALFLLTDICDLADGAVPAENSEKLLSFFMSIKLDFCSTTSLAIKGFMCEVLVS